MRTFVIILILLPSLSFSQKCDFTSHIKPNANEFSISEKKAQSILITSFYADEGGRLEEEFPNLKRKIKFDKCGVLKKQTTWFSSLDKEFTNWAVFDGNGQVLDFRDTTENQKVEYHSVPTYDVNNRINYIEHYRVENGQRKPDKTEHYIFENDKLICVVDSIPKSEFVNAYHNLTYFFYYSNNTEKEDKQKEWEKIQKSNHYKKATNAKIYWIQNGFTQTEETYYPNQKRKGDIVHFIYDKIDEFGNWLEKRSIRSGRLDVKTLREIKYY